MEQQQNQDPIKNSDQVGEGKKSKKYVLPIIIVAVVVLLLVVSIGIFILIQKKNSDNGINKQTLTPSEQINSEVNQSDIKNVEEIKVEEKIAFTIWTDDGEFLIPASENDNYYKPYYDWQVAVDGNTPIRYFCNREKFYSENSDGGYNYCNKMSIELSGLSVGEHKIVITPTNKPSVGWGFMFGFGSQDNSKAATIQDNKDKIIHIDAPLTTLAFFPGVYDGNKVKNMFREIFFGCRNLINGATVANTYNLPDEVTELDNFMDSMYAYDESLETSADISLMSGFINKNNKIESLNDFMDDIYYNNYHLTKGTDLTPIKDWFYHSTSVTNIRSFMGGMYINNYQLTIPSNLLPLKDWFFDGTPIDSRAGDPFYYSTGFASFMTHTYDNNSSLFDLSQIVFPNWIKTFILKYPGTVDIMENIFAQDDARQKTVSEPKWEDGSVLSSIVKELRIEDGLTNAYEPHGVYNGRCGIEAPAENKQKGNPFSISDTKCPEVKVIVVDEKTTSPVAKIQMCPDLKYGDKHPCAKLLQEYLNANEAKLNKIGQVGSDQNETEYYCHYTERALIKFQEDNELPVTGMFDEATKKKVYEIGDFYKSDYNFTKIEYNVGVEKGVCPPGEWRTITY